MKLHPYGPLEEAMQRANTPKLSASKKTIGFLWGVMVTLATVGIIYWINSVNKTKKEIREKENQPKNITDSGK